MHLNSLKTGGFLRRRSEKTATWRISRRRTSLRPRPCRRPTWTASDRPTTCYFGRRVIRQRKFSFVTLRRIIPGALLEWGQHGDNIEVAKRQRKFKIHPEIVETVTKGAWLVKYFIPFCRWPPEVLTQPGGTRPQLCKHFLINTW